MNTSTRLPAKKYFGSKNFIYSLIIFSIILCSENCLAQLVCPTNIEITADTSEDFCNTFVEVIADFTPFPGCPAGSISNDFNGGELDASGSYPLGITTVTFAGCEGQAICTVDVTVLPPVPACSAMNVSVPLNASGNATITGTQLYNGTGQSVCEEDLSFSVIPNTFDCSNFGNNTVTLTVSDDFGQSSTCTAVVEITDANEIICQTQNPTVFLDASGQGSISVTDVDNGTNAACPINLSLSQTDFDCTDLGINNVLLNAISTTNTELNTSCPATVTVEDNIAPICRVRAITVSLDPTTGTAIILPAAIDDGSSDNCTAILQTINGQDELLLTCADIGIFSATLLVSDQSGNTSSCDTQITVELVSNVISCLTNDITIALDDSGNASISAADIDNGSNATCGNVSLSVSPTSFDCSQIGANVVTLTVTDDNGDSANCTATVTLVDETDPDCLAKDIVVCLDANGMASITTQDIDDGSVDNCGPVTLSIDRTDFTCADLGGTSINNCLENFESYTPTFGTNAGNWNTHLGNLNILTDPISGSQVIRGNDGGGGGSAIANTTDYAFDWITAYNGLEVCFDIRYDNGNQANPATGFKTIYFYDNSGGASPYAPTNANYIRFHYNAGISNIWDRVCAPITLAQGGVLPQNAQGFWEESSPGIFNQIIQNVHGLGFILDFAGGSSISEQLYIDNICVEGLSCPSTVLTVTDPSGNSSTCSAKITVEDKLPPMCDPTVMDIVIQLDPGECGRVVDFTLPAAIDNCDPAPVSSVIAGEIMSGDELGIGSHTVNYQVEDATGNTAICSFNIEILEHIPDGLACNDIINLSLDPLTCDGALTPLMVLTGDEFGCLDSCKIEIKDTNGIVIPNLFDYTNVGNTYQYEICCGDLCCWGEVNVEFKAVPIIDCGSTQEVLACSITNADFSTVVLPTVSNSCGPVDFELVNEQWANNDDCDPDDILGVLTRCYKAEDNFGNESDVCCQTIEIKRVTLGDITIPENFTSNDCTISTHPSVTGYPEICTPLSIDFEKDFTNYNLNFLSNLTVVDIDHDGDQDFLLGGPQGNTSLFYINDGQGLFTTTSAFPPNGGVRNPIANDFDGDGFTDIVIFDGGSGINSAIFFNDGLGNFPACVKTGVGASTGTEGDFDGDGDLDLIIGTEIWINNGSQNFTFSGNSIANNFGLESFDANEDGFIDIISLVFNSVTGNSDLTLFLGDGSGTFASSSVIGSSPGTSGKIELCDINNDNLNDLFVEGFDVIFLNQIGGSFISTPLDFTLFSNFELGDLNCDGEKDLRNGSNIYLNTGNGIFSNSIFSLGINSRGEFTDIDNDGDLDFLSIEDDDVFVYFNNSQCEKCYSLNNLNSSEYCNLMVSYEDHMILEDNCHKRFMRMWNFSEWWCGGVTAPMFMPQMIEINDLTAPTITCPSDMTVTTDGGFGDCIATFMLPSATVSDDCNAPVEVDIETGVSFIDGNGGEVRLNVEDSPHTITYIAYDGCYNSSSCTMNVTVRDETQPTILCEQNTVVSLQATGTVEVFAETFNDGSFDDCMLDRFEVRKMSDAIYGQSIVYDCTDIGRDTVVLRVYDTSGNYNECMVNIEVQDNTAANISCLPNVVLDCPAVYDVNNLAIQFGMPTIDDDCSQDSIVTEITPIVNVDNCGLGRIVRRFRAEDGHGGTLSCTQVIRIENNDPFDENDIIWPQDFNTTSMCDFSDAAPGSLDSIYGFPVISEDACDLVGLDYDDQEFTFASDPTACFKILRTWTVIDWCQRNSDGTYLTWSHVQELKINNNIDPTIPNNQPGLSPTGTTISVDSTGSCLGAEVALVLAATDDCMDNVPLNYQYEILKWNLDSLKYIDPVTGGITNNATDTFDVGMYRINWLVLDGCGNSATYTHQFESINNKPPTAICLDGLSTSLTEMDTDGDNIPDTDMAIIWASDVNHGSTHSCYPDSTLVVSISSPASTTPDVFDDSLIFETAGMNLPLTLMVTDQNGNTSICNTTVLIEDNEPREFVDIFGEIKTEKNESVESVEVSMIGSSEEDMTQGQGTYAFEDMPVGGAYTIDPVKNTDILNGVSTLDLVLIQKHILQTQLLDSPYKYIAADINHDENITAIDLIQLRKLILGVYEEFPENNSWRFVDALYEFPEGIDPLELSYPEDYLIQNLNSNMWIDFVGVKIGDVNGSVIANTTEKNLSVRSNDALNLSYSVATILDEEERIISFTSDNFTEVAGFQLALEHAGLELIRIEEGLLSINDSHIGVLNPSITRFSWNSDKDALISSSSKDILFSLVFKNSELNQEQSDLNLNNLVLRSEAYRGNQLETISVKLNNSAKGLESNRSINLYQNEPNPWSSTTDIIIRASHSSNGQLVIQDVTGKTVLVKDLSLIKGENILQLNDTDVPISGIYNYSIYQNEKLITKQMIKL